MKYYMHGVGHWLGLDVHDAHAAVGQRRRLLRLAEVNAAGQLADAHDVDAVGNSLGLERGSVGELAVEQAGAEIGEKGEVFAQRQEGGALGLFLGRELFPFRAADGAEEDGVGLGAEFQRGVGEGLAVVVDAGAADVGGRVGEGEVLLLRDVGKHAQGLGHDLGSDVVTWQDGKLESRHRKGEP